MHIKGKLLKSSDKVGTKMNKLKFISRRAYSSATNFFTDIKQKEGLYLTIPNNVILFFGIQSYMRTTFLGIFLQEHKFHA